VTGPVTIAALRAAVADASVAGGGATLRVTHALDAIGWRGGDALGPEEMAQEIVPAFVACAREHGDVALLDRQIAEILRASGPLLDGSLPPVSAYLPAASEIVRRFVGAGAAAAR
jgi:hypothetical protein